MPNEAASDVSTGGPARAPRSFFLRILVFILLAGATAGLVAALAGRLPSGTETSSLIVRAAVGLGVGLLLITGVRRMVRALADAPPAPPETVDARGSDVVYECTVCGMRVRLEVAATAVPPKHCGEAMEARIS